MVCARGQGVGVEGRGAADVADKLFRERVEVPAATPPGWQARGGGGSLVDDCTDLLRLLGGVNNGVAVLQDIRGALEGWKDKGTPESVPRFQQELDPLNKWIGEPAFCWRAGLWLEPPARRTPGGGSSSSSSSARSPGVVVVQNGAPLWGGGGWGQGRRRMLLARARMS